MYYLQPLQNLLATTALTLSISAPAFSQSQSQTPKAIPAAPVLPASSPSLPARSLASQRMPNVAGLDALLQAESQQRIQTNQAICLNLPTLPSCVSGALKQPTLSPNQTPRLNFRNPTGPLPTIDNEATSGILNVCLKNPKHPICNRKAEQ
jgi:hypothetical protein